MEVKDRAKVEKAIEDFTETMQSCGVNYVLHFAARVEMPNQDKEALMTGVAAKCRGDFPLIPFLGNVAETLVSQQQKSKEVIDEVDIMMGVLEELTKNIDPFIHLLIKTKSHTLLEFLEDNFDHIQMEKVELPTDLLNMNPDEIKQGLDKVLDRLMDDHGLSDDQKDRIRAESDKAFKKFKEREADRATTDVVH